MYRTGWVFGGWEGTSTVFVVLVELDMSSCSLAYDGCDVYAMHCLSGICITINLFIYLFVLT